MITYCYYSVTETLRGIRIVLLRKISGSFYTFKTITDWGGWKNCKYMFFCYRDKTHWEKLSTLIQNWELCNRRLYCNFKICQILKHIFFIKDITVVTTLMWYVINWKMFKKARNSFISIDPVILSLDFQRAFDTVSHTCLFIWNI